eukprot:gnl/TRDRNA2_/TRDRNA2_44261_c0_seq1.p1 gnl/TRDRNA2_/TRDRNA2_44261_c0~~gnl/TRDRNA2_/TRDRNA2_44261_c0_seq1.p1  ORF type:complete len:216 (+),score=38.71 gnl/TRDRNA2_/TRDRNA2_44261_c0_seq1:49-696(+)
MAELHDAYHSMRVPYSDVAESQPVTKRGFFKLAASLTAGSCLVIMFITSTQAPAVAESTSLASLAPRGFGSRIHSAGIFGSRPSTAMSNIKVPALRGEHAAVTSGVEDMARKHPDVWPAEASLSSWSRRGFVTAATAAALGLAPMRAANADDGDTGAAAQTTPKPLDYAAYFGPFSCEFWGAKRAPGSNSCISEAEYEQKKKEAEEAQEKLRMMR